jgi:hypothetical protein
MLQLPRLTWIRFIVWLFLGLMVYFLYGVEKSSLSLEEMDAFPGIRHKLRSARRWIGGLLLAVAILLFYSGLAQQGRLSDWIGYVLAIPYQGAQLHGTIVYIGSVFLTLSLVFFYKSRKTFH